MWGYREVTLPIVKSFKDCNNYDQKLQFLTSYKNYYLPMLIILRRTIEGGAKGAVPPLGVPRGWQCPPPGNFGL